MQYTYVFISTCTCILLIFQKHFGRVQIGYLNLLNMNLIGHLYVHVYLNVSCLIFLPAILEKCMGAWPCTRMVFSILCISSGQRCQSLETCCECQSPGGWRGGLWTRTPATQSTCPTLRSTTTTCMTSWRRCRLTSSNRSEFFSSVVRSTYTCTCTCFSFYAYMYAPQT